MVERVGVAGEAGQQALDFRLAFRRKIDPGHRFDGVPRGGVHPARESHISVSMRLREAE
jgi:hypothetical protein